MSPLLAMLLIAQETSLSAPGSDSPWGVAVRGRVDAVRGSAGSGLRYDDLFHTGYGFEVELSRTWTAGCTEYGVWTSFGFDRYNQMASDLALVAGKTVFYLGLGIAYAFYVACEACLEECLGSDDDDEDEDDDVRHRSSAPSSYGSGGSRSSSSGEGKPRVRSLLKDPP